MRKLLVANWKENPRTEMAALKLFHAAAMGRGGNVVICPPFIYLEKIAMAFRKLGASAKKNLALGAQDIFWEERGAFTGEIGPKMLQSLGVRYVIIGHSERRKYAKETDAIINKKIKLALRDGLRVILCVGEPLTVRKKGMAAARAYIKNQLKKDLAGITSAKGAPGGSLAIAYEPIWAIGTGRNDKPEDAAEMACFIKRELGAFGHRPSGPLGIPYFPATSIQFLYGGSANSKNIADYVQYKEIDGALVGGASLKAAEFSKMIARAGDH